MFFWRLVKTLNPHRRREKPSKHDDGVPGLLPVGLYALALPESWRIFSSFEIRQQSENINMSSLCCIVVFWDMIQAVLINCRRYPHARLEEIFGGGHFGSEHAFRKRCKRHANSSIR